MPPRRRRRDPDPQVRDRNKWDAAGQPAVGGLSRIGGGSRGGGTNLVVRGGRGDGGQVRIEHITLHAEASQTIASGGAGVSWGRIGSAPTEIRGFETCAEELASTGAVVAIPVDVTGHVLIVAELDFTDPTSGQEMPVNGTFYTYNTHAGTDSAYRTIVDPAMTGISGPVYGWVDAGDAIHLHLDATEDVVVSGTVQVTVIVEDRVTTPTAGPSLAWGDPTVTAYVPEGTRPGDLLVAHVHASEPSVSTPAGWTRITTVTSGDAASCVDYRIAEAGDAGTAVSWTASGGVSRTKVAAGIQRVVGVHTSDPFSGAADAGVINTSADGTSIGLSTTTDTAGQLLVVAGSLIGNGVADPVTDISLPAGFSQTYMQDLNDADFRLESARKDAGVGATGTLTVSVASATPEQIVSAFLIPLRSA